MLKEDVTIGYQITAPNKISTFLSMRDDKAREFTLGTAFAHLRKAEVLADENQADQESLNPASRMDWKGLN